ncbi:MAG: 3'-5' exonuclease [Anaerolineae bacterium]|nr:3'-5' exonuclease [Anaerolineae bacterium]
MSFRRIRGDGHSSEGAGLTAAEWLAEDPLILDTETTGLGPTDEVVQVAAVDVWGETVLNTLVRPSRTIPPDATRVHGIQDVHVLDAPTGAEVLAELEPLLRNRSLCVYNAAFDLRLLRQTASTWRVRFLPPPAHCVMRLFARFVGEWNDRYGDYRWHSLSAAAERCRLGAFQGHDALADARMTLRVLRHMAGQDA